MHKQDDKRRGTLSTPGFFNNPITQPPAHSLMRSLWQASRRERRKIGGVFGASLILSTLLTCGSQLLGWPNIWADASRWQDLPVLLVRSLTIAALSVIMIFLMLPGEKRFVMAAHGGRNRN